MEPLSPPDLALGVALVVGVAVAFRLLALAWRTGRRPELWIGLTLLGVALGGAAEAAGVRALSAGALGAARVLDTSGNGLYVLATTALYLGMWRIFHPGRPWAMTAALLGSFTTAALWLPARPPEPGAFAAVETERLLFQLARSGAFLWGAWESLRCYRSLRVRVRQGLADALIAEQFKMWAIAAGSVAAMCMLAHASEVTAHVPVLGWGPGLLGVSALGLLASGSLYLAAFPPGAYRAWVTQPTEGRSPLDVFVPDHIRATDGDARRKARLICVAGAATLTLAPIFIWAVSERGGPEFTALVATLALLMAVQPLVLRATGSIALAGNLLLLVVFTGVVLGAVAHGGIQAPGVVWLVMLPVGGLLLSGFGAGVAWTLLTTATIVALYVHSQIEGPAHFTAEQLEMLPALRSLNLMAVLTAVSLMGLRSVRETDRALREMEEARNRAQEASQAKTRFLATMSHELRTPMNGALGMADLLMKTRLAPEQHRLAAGIERCGRSLLALIDDILDFSRIEAGRLTLQRIDFDLRGLFEEVLEVVTEDARAKGLEIRARVDERIPGVLRGDPQRLRQVLVNLLGNAVKFTAQGTIDLEARADSQPGPDDEMRVHFEVRDTGIGIAPEAHAQIFDRFTQADDSVTRRYGGTGLGLAIAQQLTGLMQGKIEVESRPGEGARFWFRIPLTLAKPRSRRREPASQVPSAARGGGRTDPAASRPVRSTPDGAARVLLAEDNPVNQQVTVGMLEMLGFQVQVAGDGVRAIEACERQRFDVVLMDCQMPELDGLSATRRLRRRERDAGPTRGTGDRVPIVALTASAMPGDRELCLEAGMDDYLSKPFTSAQLEEVLRRWVDPMPAGARPVAAGGSPSAREAVLDRDALDEIRALQGAGQPDLLERVVDAYLGSLPGILASLHDAVDDDDAASLWRAAHGLKSSSRSLGLGLVADLAREIEELGRAGSTKNAADLLEQLERAIAAGRQALLAETSGPAGHEHDGG